MSKIDLHIHTAISGDGEYQPKQIIQMCKVAGLSHFAISDHNAIDGVKTALKEDLLDLTLIPSIELDVTFQNVPFHLLGYGIDLDDPAYQDVEEFMLNQEREISKHLIEYSRNVLNLKFSDDAIASVSKHGVVNAEMIMDIVMQNKENEDNPVMLPYLPGGDRSDNPLVNYFWDYFGAGKDGYVHMELPKMEDLIEFLHKQGALAILAHPGNNAKENVALLNDVITLGIDGIEVYSSYHSSEQISFYHKLALENNLIMTCGSDFHGKTKPSIHIGEHGMPLNEQDKLIELLTNR